MKTPVIILLTLWSISLLITAHLHGKPKENEHNFFRMFVAVCLELWLVWWAGVFG
jgi:hypothetical protein